MNSSPHKLQTITKKLQIKPSSTAGYLVAFMMLADIIVHAYVICQTTTEKSPLCLLSCFQNRTK